MQTVLSRLLNQYLNRLPRQTRAIVQTVVYGLTGGVIGTVFHLCVHMLYDHTYPELAHQSTGWFLAGTLALIVVASMASGWLMEHFCKEAAGSGIPQLKAAYWKDFGYVPFRAVWVKFIAGLLAVGGGASLGREGPSVHMGGGLASTFSAGLGVAKQNRRRAAAAGAAAGLASAFNTPLAAITFVLEEILDDFDSRMIGGVILASVLGAFTVHAILGPQPAFTLPMVESFSWHVYGLTPVVAALAALVGVAFQVLTLRTREFSRKLAWLPAWLRPTIGALATWGLGVIVFLYFNRLGVFSLGYHDLSDALTGHMLWWVAGVLLVTKLLATSFSYGWGGCGGIFAPTLFLGAMVAVTVGGALKMVLPLEDGDVLLLAIVGMSACLGAVVGAPITSILITFEMTHEFTIVPALMLGTLVSQAVGRALLKHSFYDAVLVQDGYELQRLVPPRDLSSWQRHPVAAVAHFEPVRLESVEKVALEAVLEEHSYDRFPVIVEGELKGVVTRKEVMAAVMNDREPEVLSIPTCQRKETIREVQIKLIDSPTGMVCVLDREEGSVIGVITLHDLLRAQTALVDQSSHD